MNVTDRLKSLDFNGRDFPLLRGDVKMILKNVHNGKTEVYEKHNLVTDAMSDIFGGNYGGLVDYNSFADLYKTYLGGVLVFASALDSDPTNYGIPAYTTNPVTAHAGQTPLTSQNDDTTRGNPDDSATVLTSGSMKLVWEWGTNAGNGTISSLGLTHSDVGSYGCGSRSDGANPTCLQNLNPFVDVGNMSRTYSTYNDSASSVLAIDGNVAYTFYLVDSTTVHVYKTPINNTKFKLQGGSLLPLTDYSSRITVTIQNYNIVGEGDCYYHFDFDNQKLILFGVPTEGGSTLLMDEIDLSTWTDQTSTQSSITVADAKLWKFQVWYYSSGQQARLRIPLKAIVFDNHLFIYAYTSSRLVVNKIYKVDLSNPANISEVNVSNFSSFNTGVNQSGSRTNTRFAVMGEIIAHDSFLINGDKTFQVVGSELSAGYNQNYAIANRISSPQFGLKTSMNMVSVCKLYLATKWNLDSSVTKNASQSMTVEYTLTEV